MHFSAPCPVRQHVLLIRAICIVAQPNDLAPIRWRAAKKVIRISHEVWLNSCKSRPGGDVPNLCTPDLKNT